MNEEIKRLYEEDQRNRMGIDGEDTEQLGRIGEEDRKRRERVKILLDGGEIVEAADYYHAAMIFQHGDKPDDYQQANELAKRAMEKGEERAKWLYAASLDRWLLSTGKPQKFGTQFKRRENGEWELAEPVDPTVTDEERARYNVSPLAEARQMFE